MGKGLELTMIYALECITRNSPGYKMTHTVSREVDDDIPVFFRRKSRKKSPERISIHINLVREEE